MQLPFADQAIVSDDKILDYLLNEGHPTGRDKAVFFARLGFQRDQADVFRAALLGLLSRLDVEEVPSEFGRKFVGIGEIEGPAGRARVLTVWMLREGQPPPMLVTAYPA